MSVSIETICAQIDDVGQKAMALIEKIQGDRDALRDALKAVLARDAADRSFPQLLREAATWLDPLTSACLADCLRAKAEQIESAIGELPL